MAVGVGVEITEQFRAATVVAGEGGAVTGDSDDTVVWHPGSRPLMGVSGRESQRFVCVEAASGSTAGLSLAPGEQAHLSLQAHRLN